MAAAVASRLNLLKKNGGAFQRPAKIRQRETVPIGVGFIADLATAASGVVSRCDCRIPQEGTAGSLMPEFYN
jgi:hypothetical protein